MIPEVGKYYWIRTYRDDAPWRIAKRVMSRYIKAECCWSIMEDAELADLEYYDSEVNEVGPEIVSPPQ